ncbi:hypothetical protein C8R45DRAFT_1213362 [Mycena sanguinolenta]|nr:hypothetical protein C8R45DRAFT_1213362 [Mycena sanguinolenta]
MYAFLFAWWRACAVAFLLRSCFSSFSDTARLVVVDIVLVTVCSFPSWAIVAFVPFCLTRVMPVRRGVGGVCSKSIGIRDERDGGGDDEKDDSGARGAQPAAG